MSSGCSVTSPRIRPNGNFIQIFINFRSVDVLLDGGARVSCIGESFARSLRLKPKVTNDDLKLVSANKSPIHSLGTVEVQLSIQGVVIPWTVHVLKSLSRNAILTKVCWILHRRVLIVIIVW